MTGKTVMKITRVIRLYLENRILKIKNQKEEKTSKTRNEKRRSWATLGTGERLS